MKNNFRKFNYLLLLTLMPAFIFAQDTISIKKDSIKNLQEVIVESEKDNDFGITRLKQIEGTAIYAGKKSGFSDVWQTGCAV